VPLRAARGRFQIYFRHVHTKKAAPEDTNLMMAPCYTHRCFVTHIQILVTMRAFPSLSDAVLKFLFKRKILLQPDTIDH